MHDGIELELPIDLGLTTQREAVEPLVVSQVAEHRLDRRKASGDHVLSLRAVNALAHQGQHIGHMAGALAPQEGHLSGRCLIRLAQALSPQGAGAAVALGAVELHGRVALDRAVLAIAVELLACRTGAV